MHLVRFYLTHLTLILVILALSSGCAHNPNTIRRASTLPDSTPWDLKALSEAPEYTWFDTQSPVYSLRYTGEEFNGKATEVFAYFASPSTINGESAIGKSYPAVVLVHGGGGTAFKQWAQLWAERGYAAIAMDLGGRGEERVALDNGGPDQTDDFKFGQIDAPVTEQWSYHAVANVILAHSLLRSFHEVDTRRTAITGISWGGYLTSIVSGLDNRFKASVPVYGCGFLHENSVWLPRFAAMSPEQAAKWVELWDPSSYIASASMPVFFVNGTNDFAYWLESYKKTYDLVKGERNLRITVNMPHGHEVGWAPKEIGLYIDEHLINGTPLPKLGTPGMDNGVIRASLSTSTAIQSASFHYTTDVKANHERQWTTVPATVKQNEIHVSAPPSEANIWFFTVTDERDAIVSSEVVFVD